MSQAHPQAKHSAGYPQFWAPCFQLMACYTSFPVKLHWLLPCPCSFHPRFQGMFLHSPLSAPAHRHSDAHRERSWPEGGSREPMPAGRGLAGTARRGAGPQEVFGCLWGSLLSQVCGSHGCVSLWEGKCVLITVSHSQSHRTGAGHALPQLMPALRADSAFQNTPN